MKSGCAGQVRGSLFFTLCGAGKRWYGYGRVRYRSLVKNTRQLQPLAMALNLRRARVLTG